MATIEIGGKPYTILEDDRDSEAKARDKLDRARPSTKERRERVKDLVIREMEAPMTVRQVFYQASSVHGLVKKEERGYRIIQTDLKLLRDTGDIPYELITDNTRRILQPATFVNPQEALREAARDYRKGLWGEAECRVHFWVEKDALAGVISQVTAEYDVPLFVARGYSSTSFLKKAAGFIEEAGVVYVYHLGDFDPSGQDAAENIEKRLREMAPESEIVFECLAVTERQIIDLALPSRPTKQSDTRAASFGDKPSVELDAIKPDELRWIVQAAIEKHLPPDRFKDLMAEQISEQEMILRLVGDKDEEMVSDMNAYLATLPTWKPQTLTRRF
jgi:hypothetical protein